MGINLTQSQAAAATTKDCDLLVSAAAGSGKTAVLVERILGRITDSGKRSDIDRLLVVTFMEAAAAEMRGRIGKALSDRLKLSPLDSNIRKQLGLLQNAKITTIHSFCLYIARKYFFVSGIDPDFRVADPAEAQLLKAEVMGELWEDTYNSYYEKGENAGFIELAEFFSRGVKDDRFMDLVSDLYDFIQSSPWPDLWLREQMKRYEITDPSQIDHSDFWAAAQIEIQKRLEHAMAGVEKALALSHNPNIHSSYRDALNDDGDRVKDAVNGLHTGFAEFYEAMGFDYASLSGAKSKTLDGSMTDEEIKALKTRIQDYRNNVFKKEMDYIRKAFLLASPEDVALTIHKSREMVEALCKVMEEFSIRFAAAKKERNIADFNDLEHFALNILYERTGDGWELRPIAFEIQKSFDEILVDEYQDSNMVQEMILYAVSRKSAGRPNRFMVGDVKQSIYKFRMANPELFKEKYMSYSREPGAPERIIHLSQNFRSRQSVIHSINCIFENIMSEGLGEVGYGPEEKLYYAAGYGGYHKPEDEKAELILIDSSAEATEADEEETAELHKMEIEAGIAALRIKEMVEGPESFWVCQKDGSYRPAGYGDIVILLRSLTWGAAFEKALRDLGIPAFAGSREGFFQLMEVMTMLSFLRVVDNPRQDVDLMTVMYSPIYGFSADGLAEIRLNSKEGDFYQAVLNGNEENSGVKPELRKQIALFLADLNKWRDRVAYVPVSSLLWSIYEETGYYSYVGALPGGNIRQANLRALFEKAVEYEKTSLKGLFNFVRYIERLQKSKAEDNTAPHVEGGDMVRVMSIHKSKGLEFPLVFVCGLGRKFYSPEAGEDVILHQKLGMGIRYFDRDLRIKSDTLPRAVIADRIKSEALSEEMRILYVALTRAREKLILIGSMDGRDKIRSKFGYALENREVPLPGGRLKGENSFLSWIIAALMRHGDFQKALGIDGEISIRNDSLWDIKCKTKGDLNVAGEKDSLAYGNLLEELQGLSPEENYSGQREEVARRLGYVYPFQADRAIPAKMSVTEIKRMYYKELIQESVEMSPYPQEEFAVPAFMKAGGAGEAMRRGTVVHMILEKLDFEKEWDRDSLRELMEQLEKRKVITPEEVAGVDIKPILNLVNSRLWSRMKKAKWIRREIPFVMETPPGYLNSAWKAGEEKITVHGVIDCVFEEDGELTIVDYKTDRIGPGGLAAAADQYGAQMALYKRAVEGYTGKTVARTALYFLSAGEEVILS